MENATPEIIEKAKSWLSDQYDEETRKQVQNLIDNDPNELTESFYRILEFGTGGLLLSDGSLGNFGIDGLSVDLSFFHLCYKFNRLILSD